MLFIDQSLYTSLLAVRQTGHASHTNPKCAKMYSQFQSNFFPVSISIISKNSIDKFSYMLLTDNTNWQMQKQSSFFTSFVISWLSSSWMQLSWNSLSFSSCLRSLSLRWSSSFLVCFFFFRTETPIESPRWMWWATIMVLISSFSSSSNTFKKELKKLHQFCMTAFKIFKMETHRFYSGGVFRSSWLDRIGSSSSSFRSTVVRRHCTNSIQTQLSLKKYNGLFKTPT